MARRFIEVDGGRWEVVPSGRRTQYVKDEFGLVFRRGTGPDREERFVRYSPLGSKARDASLAELSDAELGALLRESQPAFTAPEARRTVG